jgi:hypothetical protein
MTTNVFATQTYVQGRITTGTYTGTGVQFDISTGFEPRMIQIITDDTGELVFKNKQQDSAKCVMRKNYGADQTLKSYILTANGITFGTDKVTIGTSPYVNTDGTSYSYIIWG